MIRVGLVGLGFMGGTHAQCYGALTNAELVGVADPEAERRDEFARAYGAQPYGSLEEMLASANIEAVDICLPTYLHREAVEAAARAGKHILCEKPLSLTLVDCDAMIAAAENAAVVLMVGHSRRFWPEYQVVKAVVDSGQLGRIKWMSATRWSAPPAWAWRQWITDAELSGGAVLDLHIHDLDCIAWMMSRPSALSAVGVSSPDGATQSVFTTTTGHRGGGVGMAQASAQMASSYPFLAALTVNLEGGTIEYNQRATPTLMIAHAGGQVKHPDVPQPQVPETPGAGTIGNFRALSPFFLEIQHFADSIEKGERPTVVTPEDARTALELCLAARKSAETRRPVRL